VATLNVKNLPDGLYKRLRQRARAEHRSVAQEVTKILETALCSPEPLSLLELRGLGRELWRGLDAAELVAEERRAWGEKD
jgi:plasmid stability protein